MTKLDTSMMKIIKEQVDMCTNNNAPTYERLHRVGNAILNSQQLTAQQAIYISLSPPLHSSTREVIFINTSPTEKRRLVLKQKYILLNLDSKSKDIFCDSIIGKYCKRNIRYKNLCLADYSTMFNISKHSIVKRRRQKILRYVHYNKHKDSENFYQEQCLLYLPFSDTKKQTLIRK